MVAASARGHGVPTMSPQGFFHSGAGGGAESAAPDE